MRVLQLAYTLEDACIWYHNRGLSPTCWQVVERTRWAPGFRSGCEGCRPADIERALRAARRCKTPACGPVASAGTAPCGETASPPCARRPPRRPAPAESAPTTGLSWHSTY